MNSEKVNILVVDDLPEKVLVLRTVLEELGQNIVTADSGPEALRQVLHNDFAVILLDVNMPGMDGFETAALIRQRKKSAHTPIIFITAYADDMRASRGYSIGAVDYILAPIVPEILRTKVKVFVELFQITQQVKRRADQEVALVREQAARVAAEDATRRSTFLAEASMSMASSLDFDGTVRSLLTLVIPQLADAAGIALVSEQGRIYQTELAWADADGKPRLRTIAGAGGLNVHLAETFERVLAGRKTEYLHDLKEAPSASWTWRVFTGDGEPDTNLTSVLILPMLARNKALGMLALAVGPSGRHYNTADLNMAVDLAAQAAIALDNARLYRDIQEADQRKNEFLAVLSHELRNPLAPIRSSVEIMRLSGPLEPNLKRATELIDRQVGHLIRLTDDLLDVSRVARGKIRLRHECVDLGQLVRTAAEDHRILLEAANLTLVMDLPEQPVWVNGDPTRLFQVIGNLLHNARKFTEADGEVTVQLSAYPDQGDAVLSVRDTGIGMSAEFLTRVFEPFAQGDQGLDRSRGGLGLGLGLVKGLIELHGGSVKAHSAGLGRGSEITVRLPLEREASAVVKPAPPERVNGRSLRILLIEDNPDTAESLTKLLSYVGYQVRDALNGPAGLEAARVFNPEAVLCDIGLPGMDGYAVAREFRRDPRLGKPFLIALTGYGQEEDKLRCMDAGFHYHLTKPIDLEDLEQALRHMPARSGC